MNFDGNFRRLGAIDIGPLKRLGLGLAALAAVAAWVALSSAPRPPPAAAPAEPVAAETQPAATREPFAAAPLPAASAAVSPPATDLNRQAMNAWMTGDIEAALALFERAIAASPDDPAPHGNYGRLLTLMVSYERAIPLLERARDLAPRDAQAWLDLATVYERAQRLEDSWAARAEAARLVGAGTITRDERGRFVVSGTALQ